MELGKKLIKHKPTVKCMHKIGTLLESNADLIFRCSIFSTKTNSLEEKQ